MFRYKELIELWRSDNFLTQALDDSHVMLGSTFEMFTESVKSLRESDSGEMGINIYEKDQIVNKYEQVVRRKVLKHLALTSGVNVVPGLILVTIVIDIERIGDYTKNIMDVAIAHPKKLRCGSCEDDLGRVEGGLTQLFEGVISAFKASDQEAARKLIDSKRWVIKDCDKIIIRLITTEDASLRSTDAVATAVYARYLKRIGAHLTNIASSIVNPFEKIGFREDGGH